MTTPQLRRLERHGVAFWTDPELRVAEGVVVAFSERTGGVSEGPYASLNLAGHVGDLPQLVDHNRDRLLDALAIEAQRDRLTTCEQVHGSRWATVSESEAGQGARVYGGSPPVPNTDALVTHAPDVPLMLLYADCVPVILVAPGPHVAVVHAGWRGALADLPGKTAAFMAAEGSCSPDRVRAYIGAHIRPCHYEVGEDVLSLFEASFGNLARAESGGLDLGAVVVESLTRSGVDQCCIAALGTCTAESTECFFSYRAEGGLTGRHGALACILSSF